MNARSKRNNSCRLNEEKYHPNTLRLIDIEDAVVDLGFTDRYPSKCFSYEIAKATGELGDEHPSDEAIQLAKKWFREFKRTGRIEHLEEEEGESR